MASRVVVGLLFALLLAAPFALRPDRPLPPDGARELIVITPHNEQIRAEFGAAFDAWHRAHHGEPVEVVWSVPGGTSEIRKMLTAQFVAALEAGREPGGGADLVFGGGSYEHDVLKRGVSIVVAGAERGASISVPIDFDPAWLEETYGPNEIGDARLYDPDRHWFGTALSGFGIVSNRDVLERLGVPEPRTWADLADPRLVGRVALVNPGQSGSVTTALEAILQREGWVRGWRILRRTAANARYFSGSSLKPPADVSQGDAAAGICIDFYGRFQAQAILAATGSRRVAYVDPPGVSTIDPDPISMLRGAPDPELARRFVAFILSEEGQALWQLPATDDGLGPRRFELRRMPVRRAFIARHGDRMIDQVDPFALASKVEQPVAAIRAFIPALFAALAMENHALLRQAWERIVAHPAYPATREIVVAEDVADPELAAMLRAFDAMPVLPAPQGATLDLGRAGDLEAAKRGWLRGGFAEAGLWHPEDAPEDALRRRASACFRDRYEEIIAR